MSLLGQGRAVLEMLRPDDAAALLGAGTRRLYQAGDVMIAEGDTTTFVLVILGGRVTIAVNTEPGGRLILALRGPGDVVGEQSALDGAARSATVTALVPTEAVVVPVRRFHEVLARRPAMSRVIMSAISGRLRDADSERRVLVSASLLQRVARALAELAERAGRPCEEGTLIDLHLPQHELAALVGATREGTAKALRLLREASIVLTRPGLTIIVDRDALRAIGDV